MLRNLFGRRFSGLAALMATGLFAASAHATPVTLTSGNSSIVIDPNSLVGQSSWTVDGVNQETEAWIWPTSGGPSASLESSFSTGGILSATYAGTGFNMVLNLDLIGGSTGSHTSAVTESFTFNNTSDTAMNVKLYEYEAFTIDGSASGNSLSLSGSPVNTAVQTGPQGGSVTLDATGGASAPDFYQIGNGSTILSLLSTPDQVTLNDNSTGPLLGDDAFAFEWDPTIAAGGSFQISVNKVVEGGAAVPLPNAAYGAAALLGLLTGIRVTRKLVRTIV